MTTEKSKKEKRDKIFQIPQAEQKAKIGPARTQGLPKLPCCILDDHHIKIKDKEEKEKRKKECKEKADRERTEGSIERGEEVCTEGAKSEETRQEG